MKTQNIYITLVLLLAQGIAIGQTETNTKPKRVLGFNAQAKIEAQPKIDAQAKFEAQVKKEVNDIKNATQELYSNTAKHLRHIVSKEDKITLQLLGVYTLQEKLFLKFEIFNDGNVPYYIDGWNYKTQQKIDGTSVLKPGPEPLYTHNRRENKILANTSVTKVIVFDKFTLNKNESFTVQLLEKMISRTPLIKIASKYINTPSQIVIPIQ